VEADALLHLWISFRSFWNPLLLAARGLGRGANQEEAWNLGRANRPANPLNQVREFR
jgi:hypothetical protein